MCRYAGLVDRWEPTVTQRSEKPRERQSRLARRPREVGGLAPALDVETSPTAA